MSPELITLASFVMLFVFMLTGMPVAFAILSASALGVLVFLGTKTLAIITYQVFATLLQPIYLAIPLFVFMAAMLEASGIASALYNTVHKWFGGLRGGLAIATVAFCTIIAAMTGLAATGVVTMGLLAYPEMMRRGYDKSIPLGCITAGGTLGPLIPPSVLMIILGGFAGLSVGKLFMGGVFPGLLISFLFMLYVGVISFFRPSLAPALPLEERATWKEKFASLTGVILPVLLILLVLGGIYAGAFTPTEAGGIGSLGTFICAAIYRKLNWGMLKESSITTVKVTTMVLWLLVAGGSFSALLSRAGAAKFVAELMLGLPISPIATIVLMMVIVFILGMFIDTIAIIMITVPLFMPVAIGLGFDPLWFALLLTINLLIGLITPPYGMNLFYMKGIVPSDVKLVDIYRSVTPYVVLMLIVLVISIVWPPLLIWLPNIMIK